MQPGEELVGTPRGRRRDLADRESRRACSSGSRRDAACTTMCGPHWGRCSTRSWTSRSRTSTSSSRAPSPRTGWPRSRLRLPTFFCAPNFSFLMVADAYDAVSAVPGVTRAEVTLADHHASAEINGGVAAQAGFVASPVRPGEAVAELDELRPQFLRKAALAGQDRVARPLVDAGVGPDELAALTLGAVPPSPELTGCGSAGRRSGCRTTTTRRCWCTPTGAGSRLGAGAAAPAAGPADGRGDRDQRRSTASRCSPSGTPPRPEHVRPRPRRHSPAGPWHVR